jgi:hypothetical protein
VGRSRLQLAAAASAALLVGCGIVELGTEDPDGLEDPVDPINDGDPPHPADEDVDNAEGPD